MLAPHTYGSSKTAHNLADILNEMDDDRLTKRIGVQWHRFMSLIRTLDKIDRKSPIFDYTYGHIKCDISNVDRYFYLSLVFCI